MLYIYENRIYVKPVENKLVEVTVTKRGNEYNVEATRRKLEITENIKEKLRSISLEEAYKKLNRSKFSEETSL